MKLKCHVPLLLAVCVAANLLVPGNQAFAGQPAPLKAALNPPEVQPLFRHTVFIQEDDFEGLANIDPSLPAGQRIELVSSTMAADDPELLALLAEADAQPMSDFWCHDMAEMVPDTVTEVDRDEGSVTYQFSPRPDADADSDDKAFMKNLTGELRIDEQTESVRSFRLFAKSTFRVSLAVKVKFFEMNAVCEPVATGGSRLVESTTRVEARALFKRIEQYELKRISNIERVQ